MAEKAINSWRDLVHILYREKKRLQRLRVGVKFAETVPPLNRELILIDCNTVPTGWKGTLFDILTLAEAAVPPYQGSKRFPDRREVET